MKSSINILLVAIVLSAQLFTGSGQIFKINKDIDQILSKTQNIKVVTDTIYLVPDTTAFVTNFAFYGQDRMLQWFKAPSDLYLKKVGFAFCGSSSDSITVELKFIKINYPEDSLQYLSNRQYGWYEALGNGHNNITAFLDDPDRTGNWVPFPDSAEIFEHCVTWPWGCLTGYPFVSEPDSINITYQWFDMSPIGYYYIPTGYIFGVALKNTFPEMLDGRIEIRGTSLNSGNQYSLWKFYAEDGPQPGISYGWWSRDITLGYAIIVDKVVSVEDEVNPSYRFTLEQNYPNPFNPTTKIKFEIPGQARNDITLVTLKVYDILGNEIATLVNEEKSPGTYEVEFNTSSIKHHPSSGIYFYQLKAGKFIQTKKMVYLK